MTYTRPVYCWVCGLFVEVRECDQNMAGIPMRGLHNGCAARLAKIIAEKWPTTSEEWSEAFAKAGEGDDDTATSG
jgi:hypothetical protein